MAKYAVKFTSKKDGSVKYYKSMDTHVKYLDGVRMQYWDFELTEDIHKAYTYMDADFAYDYVSEQVETFQPEWAKGFIMEAVRIPTRREEVSISISPIAKMVSLVKNYNKANTKGKSNIRKQLFNEEFIGKCIESLKQINMLK